MIDPAETAEDGGTQVTEPEAVEEDDLSFICCGCGGCNRD